MGLFDLLGWCIFGLIAGGLARFFMPGRYPMGCLATILLGIGGSIVGGYVGFLLGGDRYRPAGFILSVLGGIAILALAQLFTRRRIE